MFTILLLVIMLLHWPISEQVILDKEKNTICMRRKLLLRASEFNSTLKGARGVTFETYRSRGRLSLTYADGMRFALSTHYFPTKLLEDTVANEIRKFLGFKAKKTKLKIAVTEKIQKEQEPIEESSSDEELDASGDLMDSEGQLNWDKAIDDWESQVKERKVMRS